MLWFLILLLLAAAVLYLLHFGYKLAFYYEDPHESPYNLPDSEQTRACRQRLDETIALLEKVPFEAVATTSRDGLTLRGRYYHTADGAPLEIQCHGYKGNAIRDFSDAWQIAREDGRNVLIIDQRCHGASDGHTITFGILERFDCLDWISWAVGRFGDVPILLNGVSMGAATVLMAAGLELPPNVKGVIADCPYDSPANIIKKVLGQDMGMPVKLVYPLIRLGGILYGRFDLESGSPLAAVTRAKVPILLFHSDADGFVPYEMSCRLHAAAPERITFRTISGAGHALNCVTAPETYRRALREFTKKCI